MVNKNNITLLGNQKTKYKYNKPSYKALEWFQAPGENYDIHIDCPEFTSLCPKTGQPDFAKIVIDYRPHNRCVESKSLKLYLFSFRQFGEFHEACVNRIADDLQKVLSATWLRVEGQFMSHGGISIWPKAFRSNNDEGYL